MDEMGPAKRRIAAVAAATLVVAAVAAGVLVTRDGDGPVPVAAAPEPAPAVVAEPEPGCSTAEGAFVPTAVTIPGVIRQATVLPLPRDANGVPGIPPLSAAGKSTMAFDLGNGIRPGDPRGNALLNAHTWPDGSAIGNEMLAELDKGDQIVVHGAAGKMCYEVNDRVEVDATAQGRRYFAEKGDPQIAIVVCSGERLGPGEWTKRTLWFASPVI